MFKTVENEARSHEEMLPFLQCYNYCLQSKRLNSQVNEQTVCTYAKMKVINEGVETLNFKNQNDQFIKLTLTW